MAIGRAAALPILVLLLVLYAILLGLASWAYNRSANGVPIPGANNVTRDLSLIALITGVVGLASVFAGLHHVTRPGSGSRGAAAGTSTIASLLNLLMLGIAAKHIRIGYTHTRRLKALEAFAIIPALFQIIHTAISYMMPRRNAHHAPTAATKGSSVV